MYTKDKLIDWIAELIKDATELSQDGIEYTDDFIPDYLSLRDRSLRFLTTVFGEESDECRRFESNFDSPNSQSIKIGKRHLEGIRADIERDRIGSMKGIISAEIFTDMLEMAEHLWDNDYDVAAAVLIGGVLEEHLRQLCTKHDVEILDKGKPRKAAMLNNDLRKKNVYDETERSQVEFLYKLRNDAAHPPHIVDKGQVRLMLDGVRHFVNKYRL